MVCLGGALASVALGCTDDRDVVTRNLAGPEAQISLTDEPRLVLSRGGEPLLELGPDGFELGVAAAARDDVVYDPYRYYVPSALYDTPDLSWLTPTDARFSSVDGADPAIVDLTYPDGIAARLTITSDGPGRFAAKLTVDADRVAIFRLRAHADAEEGFYGLGEYFDSANHRGHVRAMQIEADGELESAYNEAHVPVPLLVGTRGWGLFVESPYPAAFAVAHNDDPTRVEAAFGHGPASTEGLTFHLLSADHPLDVTKRYYEITGFPGLPARWALGPMVWRDENEDQAQVESDLDMMRDLDLATNGYWIDRPYASAVNTFDFLPSQFPDPAAMTAKMHALGFRTALWHTPYLDESAAETQALRDVAEARGYYPPEHALILNRWSRPIDLTNPDALAWWQDNLRAYTDLGVEGFKLDYGEDVLAGPFADRAPWRFADGSDERTMHSQFQRHYHAAYAALLPADGGFLLCRAGTYGDQTNGVIIWPGDLDANFAEHRERITDGDNDYTAVGGLPASVIAGLTLGPSGFPFYGADTGGYRHSPPDNETFSRWFEQTALSTVMQIGTSTNDVAWELGGPNGFDQALLDRYREYTRLHLRLFPYLWSYAVRLADDGRPIQRALGLAHPELGVHPDHTYLLGDHLLVAPVVTRGTATREVHLPDGEWVHWFTGERVSGPGTVTIDAPIGRLPLFLSDTGIVPLLRPTIDTLNPTTEPARVDSYATDAGLLYARAVAHGSAAFDLFDSGRVEHATADGTTTLRFAPGNELNQGAIVELLDASAPATASGAAHPSYEALETGPPGWWYDAAERRLWVKLDPNVDATVSW